MDLRRKTIGWKKIAGLGVGLVVAGQFAGWNYGLSRASWPDMIVATFLMATLCFALSLCVAELATAIPNAVGLYTYCEESFGPAAGYGVGVAIFVALAVSTGAAAEFISAYSQFVTGFGGPVFKLILFAIIIAIHMKGVGEALLVLLVAGLIAVLSLLTFGLVMLPHFELQNVLPDGKWQIDAGGIFACIPFAIMMFIAVEQTATSAEEATNVERDIPLGMFSAIGVLLLTAMCVLVLAPGAGGASRIGAAADPLLEAMRAPAGGVAIWLAQIVGAGALFGLIATLFSLVFSASRQLFALARDGFLPALLSYQNKSGTPIVSLGTIGLIGFPLSFISPDKIIVTMVTLLTASYCVVLAGFIRLRLNRPELHRPFRAPGGVVTALIALLLSALVFVACLSANPDALIPMGAVLLIATGWYIARRRIMPVNEPEGKALDATQNT